MAPLPPSPASPECPQRSVQEAVQEAVCLSRGRRTQDLQQSEMQIHCRMHVAGRCPCNARHDRHAAGVHTSMLPRPGLQAWSVCSCFCWLGGVFFWHSLWLLFGLHVSLPGHALSPPDVPAEAPHKPELNWQRKPTDSRKQGKDPVKKQVGMCQGQVQDAHQENIPRRHEVNVRHQGKAKPTGSPLQCL